MKKYFRLFLIALFILFGGVFNYTTVQAATGVDLDALLAQLRMMSLQLQEQTPASKVKGDSVTVTSVIPAGTTVTTRAISQYGITWFFDAPVTAGVFANGDFWVKGPVKIIEMTPDFDGLQNGWEVNPVRADNKQGFDSRGNAFNASKVPSLPYLANGGQSIVKALSNIKGTGGCIDNTHPCYLKTVAVLTVLSDVPAGNGSIYFRPPYVGNDKMLYRADNMRTDLLPSLPPVAGAPSLATVQEQFKRVQFDHISGWSTRFLHPELNLPDYGSLVGTRINDGALRLMLNDPISVKMPALIAFTQQGIDFYHMLKTGSNWSADGGHAVGRKLPIIFASLMLDSAEMKQTLRDVPTTTFSEDGSTYIGKSGVALWGVEGADNERTYWNQVEGVKDGKIARDPYGFIDGGGDLIGSGYQFCCTTQVYKASALAAMLLPGGREIWGHEPFFQYIDRWVTFGAWALPDPCALVRPSAKNGTCIAGGPRYSEMHGQAKDGGSYGSVFGNNVWNAYRTKSGMPPIYKPVVSYSSQPIVVPPPTTPVVVPPPTTPVVVPRPTTPVVVPPTVPVGGTPNSPVTPNPVINGLTTVAGWTACASEGGRCSFTGTKSVRYGAGNIFITKVFTGGVTCDNKNFTDPYVRTVKSCAVMDTPIVAPVVSEPAPSTQTPVSNVPVIPSVSTVDNPVKPVVPIANPGSVANPTNSVKTTDRLNVRTAAGGFILGLQGVNSVGVVDQSKAKKVINGTTWVYVDFANGVDGWVSETYITPATNNPSTTPVTNNNQEKIKELMKKVEMLLKLLRTLQSQ